MKRILLISFLCFLTYLILFQNNNKVLICRSTTAHKYHRSMCQGLRKCTHLIETVTVSEAKRLGYDDCGYCY